MRLILEVTSAPYSGKKLELRSGENRRIGRTPKSDFVLSQDTYLSSAHFALECDADTCRLRDLNSSNGTLVNNKPVSEIILRDGDEIVAGHTTFVARLVPDSPAFESPTPVNLSAAEGSSPGVSEAVSPTEPQAMKELVLQILREQPTPLYAVLDAAKDRKVLELLTSAEAEHQSLYEGEKGEELAAFAPYLVSLPPDSKLLDELVREGWQRGWGVYLTCDGEFKSVRSYLRRFLLVQDERGREMYFRFYDPRILRLFLPTCTPAEIARFYGPLDSYLMEAEEPQVLLRFTRSSQGVERQLISLSSN